VSDPQPARYDRCIHWSNHTVLQHSPFHDLEEVQSVLMVLISTEFVRKLTRGTHFRPRLDEPEGENPFLRFLAFPLALTVVLVGQSVEAKDFLLFIRFRGEVGKQKVKE